MVRKLIKYDFQSYLRLLLPVQLILIGIAAINRIIQLFEPPAGVETLSQPSMIGYMFGFYGSSRGDAYNTVFNSSVVLYVISIAVCLLMTVIVSIVRFYQGMYTNEGYLSHTLPVTSSQHIFAKLLTSMIFTVGSLFAVFLSFMVITIGDVNAEIFKAVFYLLGKFFAEYGANAALYIAEFVILCILICCTVYLKLYCCLSVGQLAKKRKILLAFGVYFGIYIAKQILGTIMIIIAADNELMERVFEWVSDNTTAFFHIMLCGSIVLFAVICAIYFFINKYIMSKKLNLS